MKRGWYWPYALGAFLAVVVGGYAAVIYIATADPSFSVEKDYYAKGLAWDSTMAQQRANARLGWALEVEIGTAPDGQAEIRVRLADSTGSPLDGASIEAEVFHNARASDVLRASFGPGPDHRYVARLPSRRAGLWEFRFHAVRGADTFTETVTKEIGISRWPR